MIRVLQIHLILLSKRKNCKVKLVKLIIVSLVSYKKVNLIILSVNYQNLKTHLFRQGKQKQLCKCLMMISCLILHKINKIKVLKKIQMIKHLQRLLNLHKVISLVKLKRKNFIEPHKTINNANNL